MKKVLLIMAAALLMMTQCREENVTPNMPADGTVKMTVTVGPGAKTNITDNGAITWTLGDKLYVSDGTNWLGSLTLNEEDANKARGTFEGTIQGIGEGTTKCHFFYLGQDNVMEELTGTNNADISFASQDGTREGAFKYHLGHGSAEVTVIGSVATGAVRMKTKIAMAHLILKMNGADYTGSVTMDVSNTMTVSPDGTFSGSGNGITIGNNDGTPGDRYVTLIPTEATNVSFSGFATGSMTFGHGIQANNLYGMANGIEVTLTKPSYLPGEFTINSGGTKVKFSPGNLYYNGADDSHKMNSALPSGWNFYAHQYDCYASGTSSATASMEINLFTWGYGDWSTAYNTTSYQTGSGVTMDDWGTITSLPDNAGGTTWRTLTNNEWKYLLNTSGSSGRTDANRFAKAKVNGVCGLLIFPDGYNGGEAIGSITGVAALNTAKVAYPTESIPDATWTLMESHGVVFLPAAGDRDGADVNRVGSYGVYWSSTPSGSLNAYSMYFNSSFVGTSNNGRRNGISVRLVRSAS